MEDMVIGATGALARSHVGVDFKDEQECVIQGTKRAVQDRVMKHVVVQITFAKV